MRIVGECIIMHCPERERLDYNACSPGRSQGSEAVHYNVDFWIL